MYVNQINFKQVFVIAQYSTSTDDLDTLVCSLDLQEIVEFFMKMLYPEIDYPIVRQPPQSKTQYAIKLKLFSNGNRNP